VSAEIIDARSIVPFNYEKVIESVKKTHKILLTSDACERGSVLQTMAAKITHFAFDELDAQPRAEVTRLETFLRLKAGVTAQKHAMERG